MCCTLDTYSNTVHDPSRIKIPVTNAYTSQTARCKARKPSKIIKVSLVQSVVADPTLSRGLMACPLVYSLRTLQLEMKIRWVKSTSFKLMQRSRKTFADFQHLLFVVHRGEVHISQSAGIAPICLVSTDAQRSQSDTDKSLKIMCLSLSISEGRQGRRRHVVWAYSQILFC